VTIRANSHITTKILNKEYGLLVNLLKIIKNQ